VQSLLLNILDAQVRATARCWRSLRCVCDRIPPHTAVHVQTRTGGSESTLPLRGSEWSFSPVLEIANLSHSSNFDQRRLLDAFLTAMATAFF
jgi:hypothetical protein